MSQALKQPNWCEALSQEYNALIYNQIWELMPKTSYMNIVACKWIFRIKWNPDGSIEWYKACLVAKRIHQHSSVDFQETFTLMMKPTTMRTVLCLALSNS